MYRRLLFIGLFVLFFSGEAKTQVHGNKRDSLKIERDSINIGRDSINSRQDSITYMAIEKFSKKSKFTSLIHQLIFKPVVPKKGKPAKKGKVRKAKPYRLAEGKIVRNINITTLDPFGYSIQDTSVHPRIFPVKALNSLHIKTQPHIIKNLLLFKKNEPYDSMLVNESMRLIRAQKYIRDVMFYTLPTSRKADSLDIYIRESDVWSIVPAFSISKTTLKTGLTDINFTGLGNRLWVEMQRNRPAEYNVMRISYLIPNIRNSFISINIQNLFYGKNDPAKDFEFLRSYYSPISSNLQYLFIENKDLVRSIEIARSFYTPLTKWAGGIFLGQIITAQSYTQQDTIRYLSSRTNIQDYWSARSWQIFKNSTSENRITSLILSGRIVITRYPGRTPEAKTANVFNNENTYFAGIGITSRKYIQDKYIYNYGKIEDLPVGRSFGIILGIDNQQTNRLYIGLNAAWGNYYNFGYLSAHLEYGTFAGSSGFQQGVVAGRINYFTRLLNIGKWKIRQFIRPTLIFGIKRLPSDNLTFSEGMKGFEALEYSATQMIVLNLQTQSYPPWNIMGFHIGPYLFSSLGMLGNETSGFAHSHLYSSFGVGILIKNNYLTFDSFQISLTFYPFVPGNGYNIFKTNAYKTSDFGFMDFEISKPRVVDYR